MKKISLFLLALCICASFCSSCTQNKKETKVLLITGGHDFDGESFFQMMDKLPAISYTRVEHPNAYEHLKPGQIDRYDVVLLYDMPKEIPDEAKADFVGMLEKGKGLVVLHHSICSYDGWPEYKKIVGGRFNHYPWEKDGETQRPSTFKINVPMDIKVIDKDHPVTKGVKDFRVIDEAYNGTEILGDIIHPLLGTDAPESGPLICWTNNYANAKVVAFTLGHDKQVWENPSFTRILSQAIDWVGKK